MGVADTVATQINKATALTGASKSSPASPAVNVETVSRTIIAVTKTGGTVTQKFPNQANMIQWLLVNDPSIEITQVL